MIVFAFDTAMGACSVACYENGVERGLHFEPMPRGHAEGSLVAADVVCVDESF